MGLFSGELIYRGAYYWREFSISKWVGLDNYKDSLKQEDNSPKQLKHLPVIYYSFAVAAQVKVSAPFIFIFIIFISGVTFVHANLCQPANSYDYSQNKFQIKTSFFLSFQRESNS